MAGTRNHLRRTSCTIVCQEPQGVEKERDSTLDTRCREARRRGETRSPGPTFSEPASASLLTVLQPVTQNSTGVGPLCLHVDSCGF